jgi:hypothetical protein
MRVVQIILLALSAHAAVAQAQTSGFIALEGSDATAYHHDTVYTSNLFHYLQGASTLPVLVYNPAGVVDLSPYTGGVPVANTTTMTGLTLSNYSAIYIESPTGCCTADNTVLNGFGSVVKDFIAAGGNLGIENYVGGGYDGVVVGGQGASNRNMGGIGTNGPGPTCTDGETVTALGSSKGFVQPPVDGCWEHQAFRNAYWNLFGYVSLIAAAPDYFGASSDTDATAGGSALMVIGGTLGNQGNFSVNPASGFPGTTVTLTGSGFGASETINVYTFNGNKNVLLGTGTSDGTGSVSATARVPSASWGLYSLVAIGQTSGTTGVALFSMTPRLVANPKTGSAGSTFALSGFGYGAGETVNVFWNTPQTSLGLATADSSGHFSLNNLTIPTGAPIGDNIVIGKGIATHAMGGGHIIVE